MNFNTVMKVNQMLMKKARVSQEETVMTLKKENYQQVSRQILQYQYCYQTLEMTVGNGDSMTWPIMFKSRDVSRPIFYKWKAIKIS